MGKAVAIVSLLLLAACQTPSGDFCDVAKPNRFSNAVIDAMTGDEISKALAHNKKGQAMCGWKP